MAEKLVEFAGHDAEFRDASGAKYVVGPGRIVGNLSVAAYTDALLTPDRGCFCVTFECNLNDGLAYGHSNILHCSTLWPSSAVEYGAPFVEDLDTVSYLFDSRDSREIVLTDGRIIPVRLKYAGGDFSWRTVEAGLSVSFRIWASAALESGKPGYETVQYHVPYQMLLWRKALVRRIDDFMVESADYVDFAPLETSLNLPLSAIRMVAS